MSYSYTSSMSFGMLTSYSDISQGLYPSGRSKMAFSLYPSLGSLYTFLM